MAGDNVETVRTSQGIWCWKIERQSSVRRWFDLMISLEILASRGTASAKSADGDGPPELSQDQARGYMRPLIGMSAYDASPQDSCLGILSSVSWHGVVNDHLAQHMEMEMDMDMEADGQGS